MARHWQWLIVGLWLGPVRGKGSLRNESPPGRRGRSLWSGVPLVLCVFYVTVSFWLNPLEIRSCDCAASQAPAPPVTIGLFTLYQPQSITIQPMSQAPVVIELDTR